MMIDDFDIRSKALAAKMHTGRGFKPPRRWVQILYAEGATTEECWDGYDGTDEAIAALAIALVQLPVIDRVLVIKGTANRKAVKYSDMLSEYSLEDSGKDDQTVLTVKG